MVRDKGRLSFRSSSIQRRLILSKLIFWALWMVLTNQMYCLKVSVFLIIEDFFCKNKTFSNDVSRFETGSVVNLQREFVKHHYDQ